MPGTAEMEERRGAFQHVRSRHLNCGCQRRSGIVSSQQTGSISSAGLQETDPAEQQRQEIKDLKSFKFKVLLF